MQFITRVAAAFKSGQWPTLGRDSDDEDACQCGGAEEDSV
jgi:hypothetical protein